VAVGSEPRLVALREQLEAERADGAAFSEAWDRASAQVLASVATSWERDTWSRVLVTTRWAWRAAYEGRSSRVGVAMRELEAYAADGELEALRYEPVA
jgi:hypothetical protein